MAGLLAVVGKGTDQSGLRVIVYAWVREQK
jgi:hypothetical protein